MLNWAVWPHDASVPEGPAHGFELQYIDAMTRRRLSNLTRMALHVAGVCVGKTPRVRTVFASRHGELHRTVDMLTSLAHAEPLSPTAFGLSVHNASAGIFSIARRDRSSATALAAGEDTFGYALLEAHVQLRSDPAAPVLVVYADEPLPQVYAARSCAGDRPHALAVLLSHEAVRDLTLTANRSTEAPSGGMQSLAFLPWLAQGESGSWTGHRHTWRWH
ncbi:MAG: beta-ketoacyl synthase chain length factor [Burkholderiales bacterium]|nr:beta-ketoacyl synthase chain length factor [Burkholderiales bacterium]